LPYYADLTAYPHSHTEVLDPATRTYRRVHHEGFVLNVGWLDPRYPFAKQQPTTVFLENLEKFYYRVVDQTRGIHICPFCPESKSKAKWPAPSTRATILNREIVLGSAEIRVSAPGVTYACPNLIYHYIKDHDYRPPDEFIDAVMSPKAAGIGFNPPL
jgi:hypothetical protein